MESELYYRHVPSRPRPVAHRVEFLPVSDCRRDEELCKAVKPLVAVVPLQLLAPRNLAESVTVE
jgi:hypothetical protein